MCNFIPAYTGHFWNDRRTYRLKLCPNSGLFVQKVLWIWAYLMFLLAVNCKLDSAAEAAARFSARGTFLDLFLFRCGIHHRWMLFQRRSEAEFKNGGMLMSHSVAFCNSIFFTVAFHDTNALQDTPRNIIFSKLVLHNPKTIKLLWWQFMSWLID